MLPGQSCVLTTCRILSGEDYPAEGLTESPVRALAIGKAAFDLALDPAPAFRHFVFANLVGRIAEVITRMEEVAFRPVERRLEAAGLVRLGRSSLEVTDPRDLLELAAAYINDQPRPAGMADQMFCQTEGDGIPAALRKPAAWLEGCSYPGEPFSDEDILIRALGTYYR